MSSGADHVHKPLDAGLFKKFLAFYGNMIGRLSLDLNRRQVNQFRNIKLYFLPNQFNIKHSYPCLRMRGFEAKIIPRPTFLTSLR
jgi:hypothetical protein